MYLGRFSVPHAAHYRLYVDARLDRDSAAAVAMETPTTPSIPSSAGELSSRLERLCPLHVVSMLHECPGSPGARLELDFADYLAVCGARQRCHCDERADHLSTEVSMGT